MSYFTPFFIRGSHKSYSSYRLQMLDERVVIYKK